MKDTMNDANHVSTCNNNSHRFEPESQGTNGPRHSYDDAEQGFPLLKQNSTNSGYTVDKAKEAEQDAVNITDDGRESWGKKIDFLLSIIGFAVDLANVWRFPYLCHANGGGAFLIPYFTMMLLGAIPLFFMELVLGQFHRQGAIGVWKICPIFKGVGMAECLIAYLVAFYYNVVIAWSLYYLVMSFSWELPWTTCDNPWNTPNCTTTGQSVIFVDCYNATMCRNDSSGSNGTFYASELWDPNCTIPGLCGTPLECYNETVCRNSSVNINGTSASAEFFERKVLGLDQSSGIGDVGPPRWQLTLCLLAVFILLFFSLWKGVKSSGKVVWLTATMPYVILSILLVRGVLLPGAAQGIKFFVTPDSEKLLDFQVWSSAAVQVFYSTGAGFGVHLAYASYNKFNNNCYLDCLATAGINCFTSILSGLVIFSYLGYIAHKLGKEIKDVSQEGPGLVFMVYPEALATLPYPYIWAVIFFFMLITLGLDSAMGGLEAVLTGIRDEFPSIRKYKYHREILTVLVCGSAFIFALQNITNGGMYLFTIWDQMAAGVTLLLCVFSQAIAIGWFYGLDQFSKDIHQMLGFTPCWYWKLCWKFISPVFIMIIVITTIVSWTPLQFEPSSLPKYIYPIWGNVFAWLIVASSMILIPAAAIYVYFTSPGSFLQKLALSISPTWEHSAIKKGGPVKRFQLRHWLSFGRKINTPATVQGQPL